MCTKNGFDDDADSDDDGDPDGEDPPPVEPGEPPGENPDTGATDTIVVQPQPALTLDYFLTQKIVGDDVNIEIDRNTQIMVDTIFAAIDAKMNL